jgi:hypothetical protein
MELLEKCRAMEVFECFDIPNGHNNLFLLSLKEDVIRKTILGDHQTNEDNNI